MFVLNFSFAANFNILAHLVEFVKHFLQVFSNSFVHFVVLQAFTFHRATVILLHKNPNLSRTFFLSVFLFAPVPRTLGI